MPAEEYCPWQKREIWRSNSQGALVFDHPYVVWITYGKTRRFIAGGFSGGIAKRFARGAVDPTSPPVSYVSQSNHHLLWDGQLFERTCE